MSAPIRFVKVGDGGNIRNDLERYAADMRRQRYLGRGFRQAIERVVMFGTCPVYPTPTFPPLSRWSRFRIWLWSAWALLNEPIRIHLGDCPDCGECDR